MVASLRRWAVATLPVGQGGGMHPEPGDDLAQAIADRLDELGLGAHLAEAGLPSYERDDDGRAAGVCPCSCGPHNPPPPFHQRIAARASHPPPA